MPSAWVASSRPRCSEGVAPPAVSGGTRRARALTLTTRPLSSERQDTRPGLCADRPSLDGQEELCPSDRIQQGLTFCFKALQPRRVIHETLCGIRHAIEHLPRIFRRPSRHLRSSFTQHRLRRDRDDRGISIVPAREARSRNFRDVPSGLCEGRGTSLKKREKTKEQCLSAGIVGGMVYLSAPMGGRLMPNRSNPMITVSADGECWTISFCTSILRRSTNSGAVRPSDSR